MTSGMKTPIRSALRRTMAALGALGTASMIVGCAAPTPPAATPALPFDQAVAQASESLVDQARKLPPFFLNFGKHGIVIDPMLDASSGQQTATTQRLEQRVAQRVGDGRLNAEMLPFRQTSLARATYLLTGTLTRAQEVPQRSGGALLLNLALTELKSGTVVAQSKATIRDEGLDRTPARYYADSPVMVRDRVIEGYIATTAAAVGTPADAEYLKRINVATVIDEATGLYNAEQYPESLARYDAARAGEGGEQLRVLNGLYLTYARLGRTADADDAFAKMVAYGIANNQLRVKFLFNPGTTVFWSDPKVSGPYAMWLRQIAKESATAKACMSVVGHTSRTGTEPVNDALSLQRAGFIRQRLVNENASLGERSQALGRGWRENIIGSGTDDAVDALDRRVEFRVVPCAS